MGEGEGGTIWGNGTETCIISYKKQITSPGSIQDAWGWWTGMTWNDGTGSEVGGGFRIGNMCTPVAYSYWCVAERIQYCKIKKKTKKIKKVPTQKIIIFFVQVLAVLGLVAAQAFLQLLLLLTSRFSRVRLCDPQMAAHDWSALAAAAAGAVLRLQSTAFHPRGFSCCEHVVRELQ